MSLIPDQIAANHLSKLLDAANESGLPVWREITPEQAKKHVLSYVRLADVLKADHQTIHDSYTTKPNNKHWGPWYIGQLLLKQQEQAHKARMDADRMAAQSNPLAKQVAKSSDVRYDAEKQTADNIADRAFAGKLMSEHTGAQRRKVVQWAIKRIGKDPTSPAAPKNLKEFIAYRILAGVIREKKA